MSRFDRIRPWRSRRRVFACREMVELVTDYLEGALVPENRARFERHLEGCEGCTAYLEQMRQTIMVTGTLREEVIPPVAMDRLLVAFRSWRQE